MDNHFNNDETRRVPLPGSESPVPEQFTPEHFDDDREPEQPQKQPRRRRSRRQMNAGCAGSMVYMIAVVGVSLVLSIAALFMANDIFAFVKADAVKEITVSENTSVSSLAKELDDQGVINYHSVFKLYLTLKHQTDTSVLAGAYQLNPSMDYGQIVDALANTASTETVQITIPEGYSISQIRQVLLDNHICTEDALDEVLNDYSFKHDFLEDEKPAAEGWLEGYLFPDTYEVYKATLRLSIPSTRCSTTSATSMTRTSSPARRISAARCTILSRSPLLSSVRHSATMSAHALRALSTTV